ncbi:ERCC4 domain-containing protein [Xylaria arbuscula]|nr:ERCC4 domain-containing protein [Xylaria arbuscula]
MPTEVISLLSSSPVRSSSASALTSFDKTKPLNKHETSRAINYNVRRVTNAEASKNATASYLHTSTNPPIGAKRTPSYQVHADNHGGDDFLFLSDDFDTTGDLDGSFSAKPRMSRNLSNPAKRNGSPTPPRKAKALKTKPSHPERIQAIGKERRYNLVDDIEFSSSPANFPSEANREVPGVLSDPFASSPREQCSTLAARSHNLQKHPCQDRGGKTWSWPAELHADRIPSHAHETQRSSRRAVIDLSSDPPDSPPPPKTRATNSSASLKATWDPISSSAPEAHDAQQLPSSPSSATGRMSRPQPRTLADDGASDSDGLPDLDNIDFSKVRATNKISSSRPTAPVSKQVVKKAGRPTEEKIHEKKQKDEARQAEKERKRIEKERAKEERALQKEREKAMTEVNKLRTDKKVSTPEMIVDIPASINPGLQIQIQTLLGDLDVQHEIWDSTVQNVVKWRRKVTARFNKEMGLWEPIPMRIQDEDHVLVIVQAAEFVKFVLAEEGQDLEAHVLQMRSRFPSAKPIYLIEGLTAWMRKNRTLLNRQFASAVRQLGTGSEPEIPGQSRRRNNNQPQEYIDEDKIEDALLSLQVVYGTLIHHTSHPVETAQWVAVFTQHISTIPYRKVRDDGTDAGFCMESGQVRTGDGAQDTYILVLQAIARVTPAIAYGIAAKYASVPDLVRGLEEEGPLALAECRKSANKDGAPTDRVVGPAVSRRLHKIFLSRDPTSTDV